MIPYKKVIFLYFYIYIYISMPEAYNCIKKETLAQVFSGEFCEISQNTFSTEHPQATAS